jgi:hypothetical protein
MGTGRDQHEQDKRQQGAPEPCPSPFFQIDRFNSVPVHRKYRGTPGCKRAICRFGSDEMFISCAGPQQMAKSARDFIHFVDQFDCRGQRSAAPAMSRFARYCAVQPPSIE